MNYILDMFGVIVFAISGSLAAAKKRLDLFGVIVLAMVTALGGGTLRDLILDVPIFWLSDHIYILVAFLTAISTFVLARHRKPQGRLLVIADAFGLAIFTVIGTKKTLDAGFSGGVAVIMGVMTGVVGGMLRDLLAGEIPLILRREIYATASLCGAGVLVGLVFITHNEDFSSLAAVAVILVIRLAAIRWKLSLPVFFISKR